MEHLGGGNIDLVPEKVAAFLLLGADYRIKKPDDSMFFGDKIVNLREKPLTFRKGENEVITVLPVTNCTYKVQTYLKDTETLLEETRDFTKVRKIRLYDTMLGFWAVGGKTDERFHCWSRKPKNGKYETGCFKSPTGVADDVYLEILGNADDKDVQQAYRLFVQTVCPMPQ